MRFALVVIVCVALFISGVRGAGVSTPIEIDGSGSSSVSQLLSQLMLSYRQATSGITVTYNVSSSSTVRKLLASAVTEPVNADFGFSQSIVLPEEQTTAHDNGWTLTSVLQSVGAIAVFYNNPLVTSDFVRDNGRLKLNRTVIAEIFAGTITSWGDHKIHALNQKYVDAHLLPDTPINMVYRTDSSGSTKTFLRALKMIDSHFPTPFAELANWTWGPTGADSATLSQSCPTFHEEKYFNANIDVAHLPPRYVCSAANVNQMYSQVMFHPFSIGYVAASFVENVNTLIDIDNDVTDGGQEIILSLCNGARCSSTTPAGLNTQELVTPALEYSLAMPSFPDFGVDDTSSPIGNLGYAINSGGFSDDNTQHNPCGENCMYAWPFIEFNFFIIRNKIDTDCSKALQIILFMVWTMESPVAIDVMNYMGYTPIPQDVSDTLVNQLTNIKCGDPANPTLVFDYVNSEDRALRIFGWVGFSLLVVAGFLMLYKIDHPAVHHEGTYVVIFQAFGAALNCLDVYNYTGYPKDWNCKLIPWSHMLGLVLIYGIFIVRVKNFYHIDDHGHDDHGHDHHETPVEAPVEIPVLAPNPMFLRKKSTIVSVPTIDDFGMPTAPAIAPTLTRPKSWKEAKRTNRRNPNTAAAAADIAENAMAVVRSPQLGGHTAHGNDDHHEPTKPQAAHEAHDEKHEEKHEEHVDENPLSPEEDLFRRKLKCWGIVFGVLIIFIFSTPFLWAIIDKPHEFRRQCVNPNYGTYWSNLYLGWELLMILLSAIYAYYTGELGHIIHPVFIMLLMTCLFTPPSLVSVTGAHTAIDFIFNMPVKIVVGTLAEASLIMVPTIYYAYFLSPEEFHRRHHVVHEASEIKKAGIAKLKSAIQMETSLLREEAQRARSRSRGASVAHDATAHSAEAKHH